MKITKLALGTLMALSLSLTGACDDAKKDVKDAKAADAKAAAAKAADAKAADPKAADAKAADAEAAEAKAAEAKAADAKAADPKAADTGAAAGGEVTTIGVAECDEYVTKMTACITAGTVPAAEVEAQKMGLDMSAKSWADAMKTNPEGGSGLVAGCKAAVDMGKLKYPTCFPAE
jgi:hypothetical protein